MNMRTETDGLGPCLLPAQALYGIGTHRYAEMHSFSRRQLREFPELVRALAQVKLAAAFANNKAGVIDDAQFQQIEAVVGELIRGDHHEHMIADPLTGGGQIALNLNINEVMANRASQRAGKPLGTGMPLQPKQHLNASQSTADVCYSAIRIALVERHLTLVRPSLQKLHTALLQIMQRVDGVATIARTCLQDALVTQLSYKFAGFAGLVERQITALDGAATRLTILNLGGTVIGTSSGAPAAYRAELPAALKHAGLDHCSLRYDVLALVDAAQNSDDLVSYATSLSQLAVGLQRFAAQLRLLSSGPQCGIGEIGLPALAEGSSFFPGKVNPTLPETVMQACAIISGHCHTAQQAQSLGEADLNVFEGIAFYGIYESQGLLARVLDNFVRFTLDGLTAHEERCQQFVNGNQYGS